jgi:DNA-directed RNA polymerase specialized sigma24 family protein
MSEQEFVELFEREHHRLTVRLRARFGAHDADDALAEAWATCWRNRERIDARSASGYVFVVARNEGLALRRKFSQTVELLESTTAASVTYELYEELHARSQLGALLAMRPQRRTALLGRAHGYTYGEIAQATDHTYTWVNRHVTEGRRELRAKSV